MAANCSLPMQQPNKNALFTGLPMRKDAWPKTRHLLVNLEKSWVFSIFMFFRPHIAIEGFWQDRSVPKNGAQLVGAWVSKFLSHRIVKSSIFMTFSKLEFKCTRSGNQNHPFCQLSSRNTFIIFLRYFTTTFSKLILPKSNIWKFEHLEIWKSVFPGPLTSAQSFTCPAVRKDAWPQNHNLIFKIDVLHWGCLGSTQNYFCHGDRRNSPAS